MGVELETDIQEDIISIVCHRIRPIQGGYRHINFVCGFNAVSAVVESGFGWAVTVSPDLHLPEPGSVGHVRTNRKTCRSVEELLCLF